MQRVTISFDNGPSGGHTAAILDLLAQRRVPASFFVVGEELDKPDGRRCLERAKAEGHWIGNHTLTHGEPLGTVDDPGRPAREIGAMQDRIGDLAHPDRFFRPNGGGTMGQHLLSRAAVDYLAEGRYTVVTWNNVPGDWIEPQREWVDRALATMTDQEWSLLVIHDFLVAPMLPTLDRFLDEVAARNVAVVQEFPADCLPMVRGEATDRLPLVSMPA